MHATGIGLRNSEGSQGFDVKFDNEPELLWEVYLKGHFKSSILNYPLIDRSCKSYTNVTKLWLCEMYKNWKQLIVLKIVRFIIYTFNLKKRSQ